MDNKFKILFGATALLFSSVSSAAIISGNLTTDGGQTVALQGLEWLSWDITAGYTRTDIENNALGLLADGWRYATVYEFNSLFESIDGGVSDSGVSYDVGYNDGADWLWENFDNYDYINHTNHYSRIGDIFYGTETECGTTNDVSCRGHVRAYDDGYYTTDGGWMLDSYHDGTNYVHDLGIYNYGNYGQNALESTIQSSAMVRSTSVPEPSIIALFGVGILGLGFTRRRKFRQS